MENNNHALPDPEYVITAFNNTFGYGFFMGKWDKDGSAYFTSDISNARRYKRLENAEKALNRYKEVVRQRYGIESKATIVPAEMAEAYKKVRYEQAWKETREKKNEQGI